MQLSVTVVPKSGRFEIKVTKRSLLPKSKYDLGIKKKDGKIKIYLKSPAESNKANIELIRELGKILKCKVSIVSGLSSRKKILEIPLKEEELKTMLPI